MKSSSTYINQLGYWKTVMCLFLNNNINQTDTSVKGKKEHINRSLNGDQILMRMKPYLRMQELAFPAAKSFHSTRRERNVL